MQMLKELGTIHTGSTPKTNDESLFGGDVPFVTPGDLGEVTPIQTTNRTLTDEGAKTGNLLPAGAVLVCCIGSLGKIGFAGRPLVTNQQINAIVFDDTKLDARYGFFACRMLKPQLELMAPATTVPIVNKSRFSELQIPVPPLPEQRRIAAILDQAETLRTQRRTALDQLDSLTQSIFFDMFGDPITDAPRWPRTELERVAELITGYPFRSGEYVGPDEGIKLCRGANVLPGRLDWRDLACWPHAKVAEAETFRLQGGDIVMAMDRPWISEGFKLAQVDAAECPMLLVQRVARIRPKNDVTNEYLFAVLSHSAFTRHCKPTETTIPHISPKDIRSFAFELPPLPLQQTFATRIQTIEALKATHRSALSALDALFASLQQRAFQGDL